MEICDHPGSRFVTATFELPGLRKEEIGVHLTHDGRLTISGDRQPPAFLANTDPGLAVYPVKELKYGRFERTINIPAGLEVRVLIIILCHRGHSRNLCADSTLPGQGYKRVFGGWHALCFLATRHSSPCASTGASPCRQHGVKRLKFACACKALLNISHLSQRTVTVSAFVS